VHGAAQRPGPVAARRGIDAGPLRLGAELVGHIRLGGGHGLVPGRALDQRLFEEQA
jgi:hypothetical protein